MHLLCLNFYDIIISRNDLIDMPRDVLLINLLGDSQIDKLTIKINHSRSGCLGWIRDLMILKQNPRGRMTGMFIVTYPCLLVDHCGDDVKTSFEVSRKYNCCDQFNICHRQARENAIVHFSFLIQKA